MKRRQNKWRNEVKDEQIGLRIKMNADKGNRFRPLWEKSESKTGPGEGRLEGT